MSLDAMKQALAVLEEIANEVFSPYDNKLGDAILALRAAIEQAENQEPKIQALIGSRARLQIELRLVEQLLDDPDFETTASDMEYWGPLHDRLKERLAPRQWQGLTDEEILKAVGWETAEMYMKLTPNFPVEEARKETVKNARAIEAKLKEKNT